jgi:hypothetical protein
MDMKLMIARILADNDQDRAAAKEWIETESTENLMKMWLCITSQHKDPLIERMSLLAQLAMGELLAEADRFKGKTDA